MAISAAFTFPNEATASQTLSATVYIVNFEVPVSISFSASGGTFNSTSKLTDGDPPTAHANISWFSPVGTAVGTVFTISATVTDGSGGSYTTTETVTIVAAATPTPPTPTRNPNLRIAVTANRLIVMENDRDDVHSYRLQNIGLIYPRGTSEWEPPERLDP